MLRMEYVTMIPTEVFDSLLKAITSRSWLKPRWSTRSAHESLINSSRRPPTGSTRAIFFSLRLLG